MSAIRSVSVVAYVIATASALACSSARNSDTAGGGSGDPSGSEVAVSVVSGALNVNSGSGLALNGPMPKAPKPTTFERALAFLNPVGTAYAASWTCEGETLSPAFKGPGSYEFTPPSCSVTWLSDKTATSSWSGPFTLDYGTSCDAVHPFMENQGKGCDLTRTTGADGDTRTITGPEGGQYAIVHDTNGAGTGWDSTVSPAPTNAGVIITCGPNGCDTSRTLVVSGSHITGTVSLDDVSAKIWDHTVSTGSAGLSVEGAAGSRKVSGTVTVQHNLLRYTSTTTFDNVGYGDTACCFPTEGTVSTTYGKGAEEGKTETLAFSAKCGEATLTDAAGATASLTLLHCL